MAKYTNASDSLRPGQLNRLIDKIKDKPVEHVMTTNKLTFDEASHTYYLDGVIIPGVTTVLKQLMTFDRVPEDDLKRARELGTAVHKVTELYDLDTLDYNTIDPVLGPYLEAWKKFRHDEKFNPFMIEKRTYHPIHRYGLTPDRGGFYRDDPTMVDIKSGAEYPTVGPQLAAYQEAYNYRHKNKITRRLAVYLRPDGTYKLRPCNDPTDFSTFLACLHLYNWRGLYG